MWGLLLVHASGGNLSPFLWTPQADPDYISGMAMTRYHGRPCVYCKRPMDAYHPRLRPTRDHVVPKRNGGTEIVICCSKCNTIKGHMMPEEWLAFMAAHPTWFMMTLAEIRVAKGYRRIVQRGRYTGKSTVVPANLVYGNRPVIPNCVCGEEKAHPPMADALAEYADPKAQAAFEAVYRNRQHLLRKD